MSKLAIGTAQFGMPYGIANRQGQVDAASAAAILALAMQHDIRTLDTAIAYGNSEETLGSLGISGWKVISKLPEIPKNVDVSVWVKEQIRNSLTHLKIDSLYGLLLHRPQQLLSRQGADILAAMQSAQRAGLVQKIGISIYTPSELEEIISKIKIDIVQAPLNLLDRRLVDSGWTQRLKKMDVELHTRSAFLQGLLLMPSAIRPEKFRRFRSVWQEWGDWLKKTGHTPLEACLRYALSVKEVDKVIVGVDSISHLQEILSAAKGTLNDLPKWPTPIDMDLINPARWDSL